MVIEIRPVESTEIPQRRNGRGKQDTGPNLFLQPIPKGVTPAAPDGYEEGWLALSYDLGKWFDVPVEGHYETAQRAYGASKGEEYQKVVGDAADVTKMLREAADKLGIGVTIKYAEVKRKNGSVVPNQLTVKYLGVVRKQSRKGETPAETATE